MSSISSVSSTTVSQYDALAELLARAGTAHGKKVSDTMNSSSSTSSTSDSVSLSADSSASEVGNYLQQLDQLRTSDPDKYKKVTAEIASKLKDAAASETDPGKKAFLTDMATSFEKAASDGSKFEMPKPPGGPQGPPPQDDSESSSYSPSSLFDTLGTSSSDDSSSSLLSLLQSARDNSGNDTLASILGSVLDQ